MSFIVGLIAFLFSSCSEHSCVGLWEGRGYGSQVVQLNISKDGTFSFRILPEMPDTYTQLYIGRETDYKGKWESVSDDEIKLVSQKRIEEHSDLPTEYFESSDVFYLRKDGALCKYSPNYATPWYDLIKRERK